MSTVKLPPPESDINIHWQPDHVSGVQFHYEPEGRHRWLTITYKNGATRNLQPHQARSLYFDKCRTPDKGCDSPCFHRWECDSAPTDCAECQLAEKLIGLVGEVRPDPIPPRRIRRDARSYVIALLLLVIVWRLRRERGRGGEDMETLCYRTCY